MRKLSAFIFFIATVLVFSSLSPAEVVADEIGKVTRLQNSAVVTRSGQNVALREQSLIFENDEINTGADARIEITFEDDTKLTIGENSRLIINKFLYDPDKDIGELLLDAAKGPFQFISGGIGKLKDKRVEIRTSSATVGLRGTEFWGGVALGTYGILLIEGVIIVKTEAGARILNEPGTGVNITGPDVPPSEVVPWGAARVEAALSSTRFR